MEPYYRDELATLYLGDALELEEWRSGDLLLTDPPYGIGWSQPQTDRSRAHAGIRNDETTAARDAVLELWGQRPALCFGSPLLPPPAGTRQVLIWQKRNDRGLFGSVAGYRRDLEAIYLLGDYPKAAPLHSSLVKAPGNANDDTEKNCHPHVKPVALLVQLISTLGVQGTVVDPFAGSASTLLAASALGRRSIGVEIEERWAEIAANRLSQGLLFRDTASWR